MSKITKTGKDIGFKLLENADTVGDYIKIKNMYGLTNQDIKKKINDELYDTLAKVSNLEPIEQLYHLKNRKKYMLLFIDNNYPDTNHKVEVVKVGTKDEIFNEIDSILRIRLAEWDTLPVPLDNMVSDLMDDFRNYFDNRKDPKIPHSIRDPEDVILNVNDNLYSWSIIDLPSDKICTI